MGQINFLLQSKKISGFRDTEVGIQGNSTQYLMEKCTQLWPLNDVILILSHDFTS